MALWTTGECAAATQGQLTGSPEIAIRGVSIDTRTLQPGDIYIALKGPRFDGHDFIADAFKAGAVTVITEKPVDDGACIQVSDTFQALYDLARAARARSTAKMIAITGSVGKTSAKAMLAQALQPFGIIHAAEASLNNHWGVPLTLARLAKDADYAVFEVGMNHANEISPLSQLIQPHIALITTIAPVHIEHLGSIENIAKAKAELFHGMNAQGIALLPRDNAQLAILVAEARTQGLQTILTFSEHDSSADFQLVDCIVQAEFSKIQARFANQEHGFLLHVPGRHQAVNAVAVLGVISALGLDIAKASDSMATLQPVAGRGNKIVITLPKENGTITVIDETHNASPVAVEAALTLFGKMTNVGRRVVILGDMLELGDEGPRLHAALKIPLAEIQPDLVLTCGPLMAELDQVIDFTPHEHYADSALLVSDLTQHIQPGDSILVKGSRGSKMKLVVDALTQMGQPETPSFSSPQARSA